MRWSDLSALAELALAALGYVERDDVVARCDAGDALTDGLHHRTALMAEDGGEHSLSVPARQSVGVGVAHAGVKHAQANLALTGRGDGDGLDGEVLAGFPCDGGEAVDGLPGGGRGHGGEERASREDGRGAERGAQTEQGARQ